MGGHGNPDDVMNRRQKLLERQRSEMAEQNTVGGSNPDDEGEMKTVDTSTEAMLNQHNKDDNMETKKKKLKSPRYSDVPAYTLEALDMDTLRDEVFGPLDFTETEKEVAGAIVKNDVSDMTQQEIADLAGTSKKMASDVIQKLETRSSPTKRQREILRVARENPHASMAELGEMTGAKSSNLQRILVPYRHERIVCEVPVKVDDEENEETQGETQETQEQDDSDGDDEDTKSDESDAVQEDLKGQDVEYKYDPSEKSKRQTRGGQSLKRVRDQDHLISLIREFDRRLRELENSGVEVDVPDEIKGRITSLESQVNGIQSVVDRIEDQQQNVERYIEEEVDTSDDLERLEDEFQELKEQCQDVADAADLEWEETTLGKRVESIEESLKTHKQAIQDLRQSQSTQFSTEEKRKVIVALAESGNDDLIDRVLEEF